MAHLFRSLIRFFSITQGKTKQLSRYYVLFLKKIDRWRCAYRMVRMSCLRYISLEKKDENHSKQLYSN